MRCDGIAGALSSAGNDPPPQWTDGLVVRPSEIIQEQSVLRVVADGALAAAAVVGEGTGTVQLVSGIAEAVPIGPEVVLTPTGEVSGRGAAEDFEEIRR